MFQDEIDIELEEFGGDVCYISMLNQFVWCHNDKKIVGYDTQVTKYNQLEVMTTVPVNLDGTTLLKYIEENEIGEEDVLVFCINQDYYPKKEGNYVLIKTIKNVNKKRNEYRNE